MEGKKILCLIPTLRDDPSKTIDSVFKQTLKVSSIIVIVGSKRLYNQIAALSSNIIEIIYFKPNTDDYLGKRVARALNVALSHINLEDYDYILRIDADTMLPPKFIENNIKANADQIGTSGYAMLLKASSFIDVFKGKFTEVGAEDSYIGLHFLRSGCSVKQWICKPNLMRKSGQHHSYRHYYDRGIEMYKLGYEPIHVFETFFHDIRSIFSSLGYILAIFKKIERYEISDWVFKTQIRRLIHKKQFNSSNYS
ncbi:MAG: glycosyltransferase [archaeon]